MSFDITRLATILRDAAKAEILPRFRRLDAGMVRQKSEAIDLVTEADESAERSIPELTARLRIDGIAVRRAREVRFSLEDVFISIVEQARLQGKVGQEA